MSLEPRTPPKNLIDLCARLRDAKPPIYVGTSELKQGRIVINPACLAEEEIETLANQLRQCLELI